MIVVNNYSSPSFQAIPGKKLLSSVAKEVDYDAMRLEKFKSLFNSSFYNNVDDGLVVDLDKRGNFIFSHNSLGGVKFLQKSFGFNLNDIARSVLNTCSKTIANGEIMLFRTFIANSVKNGMGFDELRKIQAFINREKSRENFLETILVAERIKKKTPSSMLKSWEFDEMNMIIAEEDMKNPNSELSRFMNSVFKIIV